MRNLTHHNLVPGNPRELLVRIEPRMFGSTAQPSFQPLGFTLMGWFNSNIIWTKNETISN